MEKAGSCQRKRLERFKADGMERFFVSTNRMIDVVTLAAGSPRSWWGNAGLRVPHSLGLALDATPLQSYKPRNAYDPISNDAALILAD